MKIAMIKSQILAFVSLGVLALFAVPNESVVQAKEELARHLTLVTGDAQAGGKWKFRFEVPPGETCPTDYESFYRIDGDTVWFWGDDQGRRRFQRWGTLFAVELFASEQLGIRWLWPGEDGTVYTPRKELDLPARHTGMFRPPLAKSHFRNNAKSARFRDYEGFAPRELRMTTEASCAKDHEDRRLFLWRHRLQDRERFGYGHAYTKWKARFAKSHPEFLNYSRKRKVRGFTGSGGPDRVKLCVSNPAVVDQVVADWLAAGTNRYLNVCENDSANYCECEGCTALDVLKPGEEPYTFVTDRYVDFWNRVADKVLAIRPDAILVAYAYSHYRFAPRRTRVKHPEHMLFGFVPSIMDDAGAEFRKWREMGMAHFFLRPNYHCFWGTIPRGMERFLYDNFHECLSYGMIGVDYDSNLGRYPMNLESYVTARMIADPKAPFEVICDEFYSGYGAAKADVKRYFEAVRAAGEAAREAFRAAKIDTTHILDDSVLSTVQAFGRSEEELRAEWAILEKARANPALDAVAKRRLDDLAVRAEHAIHTFRFLSGQKLPPAEFERRGRELIDFRVREKAHLPDDWGSIFGRWEGEIRTWNKLDSWKASIDGGSVDPRGLAHGVTVSFERPGFPFGWRGRDGFLAITNAYASHGEYSVQLSTPGQKSWSRLGIWRAAQPVVPGARYRLSADFRADEGVGGHLRVVAPAVPEQGIATNRELVAEANMKLPAGKWENFAVTFTAPQEFPTNRPVPSVTLYVNSVRGGEGKFLWVDNIRVQQL